MNVRWFQSRAAFLLPAFTVFLAGVLPQQRNVEASDHTPRLRFGQTLAISDFDSDGLMDEARLNSSSSHKSLKVLLSRTRKLLTLSFDSSGFDCGSVLAEDVDKDGATDLIWTDLIDSNDVVVWLGDGSGQFARDNSRAYVRGFTLGDTTVTPPDEASHETALSCESKPPFEQSLAHNTGLRVPTALTRRLSDQALIVPPAINLPADRGPPSIAS